MCEQVFGNVTHILPGGATEGTLDHMDFYLRAMRALAGRKPVQTLFTVDDKNEVGMVRSSHEQRLVAHDFILPNPAPMVVGFD
jgi:hypothetical protein